MSECFTPAYILRSAKEMPKHFALGADALAILRPYLETLAEEARNEHTGTQREEAARQCEAALTWLEDAHIAGLLEDCTRAELEAAEEEWSTLKTALSHEENK